MKIVVLIKQVPDTNEVRIDPKTGTLVREGVPSIINPEDRHALEESLNLRERFGGSITVLSMGPPQAKVALQEARAMGADECILLSDRAFAGSDTWATCYALGMAIKKIKDYDLIICGRQAIDGDTAQVGPQVAEFLDHPQVTYVRELKYLKDSHSIVVSRAMEDGYERIEAQLPALITVLADLNEPRYPTLRGIVKACRHTKYPVWSAKDINADLTRTGLDGSPTNVKRSFAPEPKGGGQIFQGSAKEKVLTLVEQIRKDNVVRER